MTIQLIFQIDFWVESNLAAVSVLTHLSESREALKTIRRKLQLFLNNLPLMLSVWAVYLWFSFILWEWGNSCHPLDMSPDC